MTHEGSQYPPFVTAARVAGRLHGVLATAKGITLSSSNAKSIAARGGDKTAGFRPITDFVNEMAEDTIALVSRVHQAALEMSVASVEKLRAIDARARFSQACEALSGQESERRLRGIVTELDGRITGFQQRERHTIELLHGLFNDIDQRTRAAKMIATNSRTEASRAGDFRPYLESIADNVESATESIHREIRVCRDYLSDLTEAISAS